MDKKFSNLLPRFIFTLNSKNILEKKGKIPYLVKGIDENTKYGNIPLVRVSKKKVISSD